MRPQYQFRLKNAAGLYLKVVAGVVVTSITAVNHDENVVDWDKIKLSWIRQKTFKGVFRKYAPDDVRFCGDAAKILRHQYNTAGRIQSSCTLEVMMLKSNNLGYQLLGEWAINFGYYKSDELYVYVKLEDAGLASKLNAYSDTNNEITLGNPSTDADTEYIYLDGVNLLGAFNWETEKFPGSGPVGNQGIIITSTSNSGAGDIENRPIALLYINQEGPYSVITPMTPFKNTVVPGGFFEQAYAFKVIENFAGTLPFNLSFSDIANSVASDQPVTLTARMAVYNDDNFSALVTDVLLWTDPHGAITPGTSSATTGASFSTTYNFLQGQYVILYWRGTASTPLTAGQSIILDIWYTTLPGTLSMSYVYRQPATVARAMWHRNVFKKLFHKLTNSTSVDPISNYLSTDIYPSPSTYGVNPYTTMYTCGDAIRRLETIAGADAPVLNISVNQFVKDAFVSNGAGVGIERDGSGDEVLRLELLPHFFDKDTLAADLGVNISNFTHYPYTEYLANNITGGYQDQNYDEVNGRLETNSQVKWKTEVTRLEAADDVVCPFRADPYGIEYVRANLAGKKTTDSKADNEVFKVQSGGGTTVVAGVSPDPYTLGRGQSITAGLPSDVHTSIFNIQFTPWRQMGRLLTWLKSIYYGLPVQLLERVEIKKNGNLISYQYAGPGVTEADDIDVSGTTEEILFIPEVVEVRAVVPINIPEIMETTPYGVFRFTLVRGLNRYTIDGFALDVGIVPATRNTYDMKLLLSPNTPLPDNI